MTSLNEIILIDINYLKLKDGKELPFLHCRQGSNYFNVYLSSDKVDKYVSMIGSDISANINFRPDVKTGQFKPYITK